MAGKRRIPPITRRAVPDATPLERALRELHARLIAEALREVRNAPMPRRKPPPPKGGPPKAAALGRKSSG